MKSATTWQRNAKRQRKQRKTITATVNKRRSSQSRLFCMSSSETRSLSVVKRACYATDGCNGHSMISRRSCLLTTTEISFPTPPNTNHPLPRVRTSKRTNKRSIHGSNENQPTNQPINRQRVKGTKEEETKKPTTKNEQTNDVAATVYLIRLKTAKWSLILSIIVYVLCTLVAVYFTDNCRRTRVPGMSADSSAKPTVL